MGIIYVIRICVNYGHYIIRICVNYVDGCVHFDRDSYSIRESMNSLPVTLTLTTVASYDIYVLIATAANTASELCMYSTAELAIQCLYIRKILSGEGTGIGSTHSLLYIDFVQSAPLISTPTKVSINNKYGSLLLARKG